MFKPAVGSRQRHLLFAGRFQLQEKGIGRGPFRGTALFASLTEPAFAVSAHPGDEPLAAPGRRRDLPTVATLTAHRAGWSPDMDTAPGGAAVHHSDGPLYGQLPSPQGRAVPPILTPAAEAAADKIGSPTRRVAAAIAVLDPMGDLPGADLRHRNEGDQP